MWLRLRNVSNHPRWNLFQQFHRPKKRKWMTPPAKVVTLKTPRTKVQIVWNRQIIIPKWIEGLKTTQGVLPLTLKVVPMVNTAQPRAITVFIRPEVIRMKMSSMLLVTFKTKCRLGGSFLAISNLSSKKRPTGIVSDFLTMWNLNRGGFTVSKQQQ